MDEESAVARAHDPLPAAEPPEGDEVVWRVREMLNALLKPSFVYRMGFSVGYQNGGWTTPDRPLTRSGRTRARRAALEVESIVREHVLRHRDVYVTEPLDEV